MGRAKRVPNQKVRAKRNSNLLLTQKKTVLLLQSRVIEQYPDWAAILSEAPLSRSRLQELTPEQQQFAHNLLPAVLAQAEKEWRLADGGWYDDRGPYEENFIGCSLCNTPNRYIYYIVNTLNGTRLNVGSECYKEFSIDIDGDSLAVLKSDQIRLARKAELDRWFPGVEFTVSNWDHEVDRFPFVIPLALHQPFERLGTHALGLYGKYVDPERKWTKEENGQELIVALEQALNERVQMLSQMADYVNNMKGNRFAAPTRIISWLQRRGNAADSIAIEWLREDGVIKGRTAFRIPEPELMQSLMPDLNRLLKDVGFVVVQAVPAQAVYLVQQRTGPRIQMAIKHEDLLSQCGPILLDGAPYDITVDYIVEKSTIAIADTQSRDATLGEFSALLNKRGLRGVAGDPALEDASASFNEWVLLERISNKLIVVTNLNRLVNEFKGLVFQVGSKTVEQLYHSITHNARRFERDELKRDYGRRLQERRELRGR